MARRMVLAGYLLWMTVAVALYFFVPSLEVPAWTAAGVGSTLAILLGVRLNRPEPPGPWLLLAGAVFTYAVADFVYYLALGHPDAGLNPRTDDVLYVIMFVLLTAGLLRLTRTGAAAHDRAALIDALIFMCGIGLLCWIFIVERRVVGPEPDLIAKITAVAYPLADVAILAMVARLVVAVRWTPTVLLLAFGAAGMLVSDVIYRLIRIEGSWTSGGPVDVGWLAFYVCWGAAALHPSMRALTAPRATARRPTTALRLGLLALASMIPPDDPPGGSDHQPGRQPRRDHRHRLRGDVPAGAVPARRRGRRAPRSDRPRAGIAAGHHGSRRRDRQGRHPGGARRRRPRAAAAARAVPAGAPAGRPRAVARRYGRTAVRGARRAGGADPAAGRLAAARRRGPTRAARDHAGLPAGARRTAGRWLPPRRPAGLGARARPGRRAEHAFGARLAGRPRARPGGDQPGAEPPPQRGVLPRARAQHRRRHPDRRRRQPDRLREPLRGGRLR